MLARVLPLAGKYFVADSPYVLEASARDWLDYFARVVEARSPADAAGGREKPKGKLSSKQQANIADPGRN